MKFPYLNGWKKLKSINNVEVVHVNVVSLDDAIKND